MTVTQVNAALRYPAVGDLEAVAATVIRVLEQAELQKGSDSSGFFGALADTRMWRALPHTGRYSESAHTIDTGKARNRRNAEIALVEAVSRWTAEVAELLPERMAELRAIVDYGLHHPQKPPSQNG